MDSQLHNNSTVSRLGFSDGTIGISFSLEGPHASNDLLFRPRDDLKNVQFNKSKNFDFHCLTKPTASGLTMASLKVGLSPLLARVTRSAWFKYSTKLSWESFCRGSAIKAPRVL